MIRQCLLLSSLLVLTLGCGCNSHSSWQARTVPIVGTIRINGETPVGANIQFLPLGDQFDSRGSCPFGVIGEDGVFTLTTYKPNDGCPVGEFAVSIFWPTVPGGDTDRLDEAFLTKENPLAVVNVTSSTRKLEPIDVSGVQILGGSR